MRILIVPTILLLSFVVYLSFSNPNMIVVSEDLILHDISNKVREAIQGKEFWIHQLNEVKRYKRKLEGGLALNRKQESKQSELLLEAKSRQGDTPPESYTAVQVDEFWAAREAGLVRRVEDIGREYEQQQKVVAGNFPELDKLIVSIQGHIKTLE
ncbi:MAG: hypothetical protein NWF05_03680 [Candidatus Bathyarchaeota archaeon]|nr:hypothetical protein [Candidatus Bathyarchaeota archaeon]